jgi:hypothetical protein
VPRFRSQSTSYPEASLLLELLSPSTSLAVADTPLGRGLVSPEGSPKGSLLLDIDWCNVITVTDDPEKTGNAYGQQALEDWQLVHGELPPLLRSFLLSGQAPTIQIREYWVTIEVKKTLFNRHKAERYGPCRLGIITHDSNGTSASMWT